ncbi:pyridoxamine 5'-phosphate oxidase family protein [Mycolicibacterium sp. 3033]|nr:pyridoxamine 5'-phosphate oxidase family protein [Mycolicibacterium aurantiacum]
MSSHYGSIAFTDSVRAAQRDHGSLAFYDRKRVEGRANPGRDALTPAETEYLAERDGFYIATVSETGWPYVQFRGGPIGFIRVVDENTIGWADFRGNLQYISVGNLAGVRRIALIAMDYVHRRRLKIFGRARIVTAEEDGDLVQSFSNPEYGATVERAVVVSVDAFDWNCPQHITARYTEAELRTYLESIHNRLTALESENQGLREQISRSQEASRQSAPTSDSD